MKTTGLDAETFALETGAETKLEGKGRGAWGEVKVPDRGVVAFSSSPGGCTLQIRSSGATTDGGKSRRAYSVAWLDAEMADDLAHWLSAWARENRGLADAAAASDAELEETITPHGEFKIYTNCRGYALDGGLDGWCWQAWSGELIAYGRTEESAIEHLREKRAQRAGEGSRS